MKPERGKDFSVLWKARLNKPPKVNAPIIKGYIKQLKEIYADADQTELMKMAVRMPDAMLSVMKLMKMTAQIKVVIEEAP
jgi:ribosomal protein L20